MVRAAAQTSALAGGHPQLLPEHLLKAMFSDRDRLALNLIRAAGGDPDLASAWASDRSGQPLYPLQPGTGRQREMAIRGGVNIVMYALTGNYKADQVHVRDLLDRLGL